MELDKRIRDVLLIEELPTTYNEECFWWLDRE